MAAARAPHEAGPCTAPPCSAAPATPTVSPRAACPGMVPSPHAAPPHATAPLPTATGDPHAAGATANTGAPYPSSPAASLNADTADWPAPSAPSMGSGAASSPAARGSGLQSPPGPGSQVLLGLCPGLLTAAPPLLPWPPLHPAPWAGDPSGPDGPVRLRFGVPSTCSCPCLSPDASFIATCPCASSDAPPSGTCPCPLSSSCCPRTGGMPTCVSTCGAAWAPHTGGLGAHCAAASSPCPLAPPWAHPAASPPPQS